MILTDIEKSHVRGIIYSPQWKSIEKIAEAVIQKFRGENTLGESEWETLKDTVLKEGKAQGVEQFFQELLIQSVDKE